MTISVQANKLPDYNEEMFCLKSKSGFQLI